MLKEELEELKKIEERRKQSFFENFLEKINIFYCKKCNKKLSEVDIEWKNEVLADVEYYILEIVCCEKMIYGRDYVGRIRDVEHAIERLHEDWENGYVLTKHHFRRYDENGFRIPD